MKKVTGATFAFLGVLFFSACHPRPIEDFVLADVALKAAQKVKADALAPDIYRKAENFFLRAKKDYADGYYDSCKNFSNKARIHAEQAEFIALKKQADLKDKAIDDDAVEAPPPPPAPGQPPPEATP
jgi:hypothetical protein